MKKAKPTPDRARVVRLEELMNVGPSVAGDLRLIDINTPQDLIGRDPYQLYDMVCERTGYRHDPCLIDTFISIVRFMDGDDAQPWWKYTAERKRELARTP